jgi:hypothetical protein
MLRAQLPPRRALNRAIFRGARIESRTRHHVKLRRGARQTTVPFFGDELPAAIVERIQRDLRIDFARSPHARPRPRTRRKSPEAQP